jgi:putative ABC transport system substrate-binding protein
MMAGGACDMASLSVRNLDDDLVARPAANALRRGIAAFGSFADDAAAGFLLAYGVNRDSESADAAVYVDKILKGAKPADLPVELPTRFTLAVNLKTAKALGITSPQLIFPRADEVIE